MKTIAKYFFPTLTVLLAIALAGVLAYNAGWNDARRAETAGARDALGAEADQRQQQVYSDLNRLNQERQIQLATLQPLMTAQALPAATPAP